jgi:hypothetical protein
VLHCGPHMVSDCVFWDFSCLICLDIRLLMTGKKIISASTGNCAVTGIVLSHTVLTSLWFKKQCDGVDDWGSGSFPSRGNRFPSSPQRPDCLGSLDWLWVLAILLASGYRGPGVKCWRLESDFSTPSCARSKIAWSFAFTLTYVVMARRVNKLMDRFNSTIYCHV